MGMFKSAVIAACVGLLPLGAFAEDAPTETEKIDTTVDKLSLGEYWYGAKITMEDLKGKVVLYEMWGS